MNLDLMRVIDKQFLETPFYGVRQMTWHLRNEDHLVNEKRIGRLRLDPRTQNYITKRIAAGNSKLEAIRSLKRYIARDVFSIIMRRHKEINQAQIAA